jgi:acid phosphatase
MQCSCGGGPAQITPPPPSPGGGFPQVSHVVVVVEENHSFSETIGNSAMPYFNSLTPQGGLATQYFANIHNSLPNYFELTVGATVATDDSFTGTITQDNVVRELVAAGKTWKCYAESLPSTGYTGVSVEPYVKDHDPFAYFSDVLNDSVQASNIVPFTQFANDLANDQLPDYAFIVPNQQHNAHDCPPGMSGCTDDTKLASADTWLHTNIDSLVQNVPFQQDGILIILFDESDIIDTQHGGGQVPFLVLGAKVKAGYQSTTLYQHQSTLRLTLEALGVKTWPGDAASAPQMAEFFQ